MRDALDADPKFAAEWAAKRSELLRGLVAREASAAAMHGFLARMAEVVPGLTAEHEPERMVDQLIELIIGGLDLIIPWIEERADPISDAGLVIPISQMAPQELGDLLRAHRDQGAPAAVAYVRDFYDRLFSRPGLLAAFRENWRGDPFLGRRIGPLSDGLAAHEARLFGASIPVLVAQLEGLVADVHAHTGVMHAKQWQGYLHALTKGDPFTGTLVAQFVDRELTARFHHGDPPTGQLRRHAIVHGGDVAYGTETNSRTMILLVDYFAFWKRLADSRAGG